MDTSSKEPPAGWEERLFAETEAALERSATSPLSTYRLQLGPAFRFDDARRLIPYLSRLGATDLYLSPCLRATPGSSHGYDVIDHQSIHPELGTEEDFAALSESLKTHGMGLLLDFVPNHMGIERGNALWQDVLENGPASLSAHFFDIDWHPLKAALNNKVLLPILGDQYGTVLERGELKLRFREGALEVCYFDSVLPVSMRQYPTVLEHTPWGEGAQEDPAFVELKSIVTALEHLPRRCDTDESKRAERNREKEVIKRRLAALAMAAPSVRELIDRNVTLLNGKVGDAESFKALDALLSQCGFRVAHWRVAGEEINYRRFFDINSLAAIRAEDVRVFEETHALVFRWIEEERVTGLRIDHPDGLFDPTQYFLRLQEEHFVRAARRRAHRQALGVEAHAVDDALRPLFRRARQERPQAPGLNSLYVVVEKIQGGRERIPDAWAVHGTTGYRFANAVTGLFVNPAAEPALTKTYQRFVGHRVAFADLVYDKKKLVLGSLMASEVNVLARELDRLSEMNRHTRDFTLSTLKRALVEFIARFPVYRTYVDDWRTDVDARDLRYIRWTLRQCREKDATLSPSVYEFLEQVLLREYADHVPADQRGVMLGFAMKLQQVTGPVMAKGLEDTVFYLYNRLVALNEVGGEPDHFGTPLALFHLRNQERVEKWPATLLETTTHDTKRGEDVRTRIAALTEFPAQWTVSVRRWARWNRRYKGRAHGERAPDANDEYLFYQTLVGTWPMGAPEPADAGKALQERLAEYMLKAIREAKHHTSWVNPDPEYEAATRSFVMRTLEPVNRRFLADLAAFVGLVERPSCVSSLSQAVLKLASPGATDTYQGCELWNLSLVDPDNRRPVDFSLLARLLEELDEAAQGDREGLCRQIFGNMADGRIKMFVLSQGMRFRKSCEALFRKGDYVPLDVVGPSMEQVIAFARHQGGQCALALVPRWVAGSLPNWPQAFENTRVLLPAGSLWQDVFTGRTLDASGDSSGRSLSLAEAWRLFPVALLEKKAA